jgi:acetyl-CoA acetyltransferase
VKVLGRADIRLCGARSGRHHYFSGSGGCSAEGLQDGRRHGAGYQFAEVHDCFTIAEIIATEDLGFFKGEGGPYALAGCTRLTGQMPINTGGGLKSKGHPVGAMAWDRFAT